MTACSRSSLLIALFAFLACAATLTAQDFSRYTPGNASVEEAIKAGTLAKPLARMKYFYERVTYPGGVIPDGARAKAFQQAQTTMRLYNPAGRNGVQAAFEWKNVGPFNIGGRTNAIGVNPKNPNVIYIGAADGGMWRSNDEGKSWRSVSDNWPIQTMGSIVVDPVDTNIVYAGTGEANYSGDCYDGGGMFKSTDGGDTWNEIGAGTLPAYARCSDMVIDPLHTNVLYAAIPAGVRSQDQEGIWKTTDGGATWMLILTGRMNDIVIDPQNPDILYTASSKIYDGAILPRHGMLKTTDAGTTWAPLNIGVVDSLMGRTAIAISASNPNVLYIGVSEVVGTGRTWLLGVFKTTDAGQNWKKLTVPFDYMVSQGSYDNIIGVHPTNPDIVIAGGVKLIRSGDGGATWERIPDQGSGGLLHVDEHAIEFNPANPDRVFVGNDGGFYIVTNAGRDVVKSDLGLSITQFMGGAMHPSSDAFLLGGTQDNGSMITSNAPMWATTLYGDGGRNAINQSRPNVMYTTMEFLKFWRSDDFGQTWIQAMGGMPLDQSMFYIDYAMDPTNSSTLYLGTYKMYKTTNEGKLWTLQKDCFFPTGTSCYYISAVSVAAYDGQVAFAGATGGNVGITSNGGATWTIVKDSLPTAYVSAVKSFEPGTVYATYSRYGVPKVWKSTTFGNTWASINGNLPDIPAFDIIKLDGKLILGTEGGVFISDDEGTTWQRFGTGLPALVIERLLYNANTGTLRAVTHGRGMYDLPWKTIPAAAPVFLSKPDTTMLEAGQPFLYAPVITASPAAAFTLVDAPVGATIDPALGIVRWKGGDKVGRFTIQASNTAGTAQQMFTLTTTDVVLADWTIVRSTPMSSGVNIMRYAGENTLWVGRDSAIVSRSVDGGVTWEDFQIPGTRDLVYGMHAFDRDRLIVGTRGGRLFKTTDGGATWRLVLYRMGGFFGNIHFTDNANGILVGVVERDTSAVFLTTDGGETWTENGTRLNIFNQGLMFASTMHFFDRMNGWIVSMNQETSPPADARIFRTTDGGVVWNSYNTSTRAVSSISFLAKLRGFFVDPVYGRVKRTVNGGSSWNNTFYPMNSMRNINVYCDTLHQQVWIVGDSISWVSTDQGNSWKRAYMVPAGVVQSSAFDGNGRAWAISRRGIVQTLTRNPVTGVDAVERPLPGLHIGQSYPNPVVSGRDAVTLPFTLGAAAHVIMKIHNSAGKEVATLIDGPAGAGSYALTWDPAGAVSGVYFCTLVAGTEKAVSRIVVTK